MMTITVFMLGPNSVTTASANMIVGNERTASNNSSRMLSSQRGP